MRGGAVGDRCCLDFLVLWLYHGLGDDDTGPPAWPTARSAIYPI